MPQWLMRDDRTAILAGESSYLPMPRQQPLQSAERARTQPMPPSTVLTVNDLAKSFGPDEIFRNVSFQVADREHVALVGVNGAGKSTLLRIIAGIDTASQGEIAIARGARVAVLAQEPRFESDRTVRQEAQLAFDEALSALARMRELEDAMQSASGDALDQLFQEYERLSLHFEVAGGFDVEHRTDEVLMGLGFSSEQMDEPVRTLSGGQKTRIALAKALLADPDLLLLDEPTNHLDLGMLDWLEGFLGSWRGAFLVVSHDRYFLDRVTSRTLDLSFGRLEDYPAPYGRYLLLRAERRARQLQEYEEQQELIARTEEFIRRYKAGQRSREARGRQTRLDRLERLDRPQEHAALTLRVQPTIRSGREVLTATPLRVGYSGSGGERVLREHSGTASRAWRSRRHHRPERQRQIDTPANDRRRASSPFRSCRALARTSRSATTLRVTRACPLTDRRSRSWLPRSR